MKLMVQPLKLEPHTSTQEDNRAVKVLITTLDQYRHDPNIFVICTTNNPEKMDPAILRRFTCIEVPLPNYITRKQILEHYLKRQGIPVSDEDENAVSPGFLESLVCATDGFNGDALEDMVSNAHLHTKLELEPEHNVGMGFWLRGIDTSKSLYKNVMGLLENPYVPLIHWLGGYRITELDNHLYSQYKRHAKLKTEIEKRERANDPINKTWNQSWSLKTKAAALSILSSIQHGICTGIGGDIYSVAIKQPAKDAWEKVRNKAATPAPAAP